MANPLEGSARFVFDGREYELVLDNRVMIEAEDVLGGSWLDAVEQYKRETAMGLKPRLKTICAIVYGGLKRNHPDITQDEVIEMMFSEEPGIVAAVNQAMRGAQSPDIAPPPVRAGNAQKPAKARNRKSAGTGK